jgi:hypothetical protein
VGITNENHKYYQGDQEAAIYGKIVVSKTEELKNTNSQTKKRKN